MTVEELIIELQQMNPCSEVRLAMQPNYPFEYSIDGVVEMEPDVDPASPDYDPDDFVDHPSVVYLSEGVQLGYLPQEACDEIGW